MAALGIVESKRIAAGAVMADLMVKAADVTLVKAAPICSGRYMIQVSGDTAAVTAAVDTACASGLGLRASFVISRISDQVLSVLGRPLVTERQGALGIVEAKTASAAIPGADAAVKAADVTLVRLVTGQGINGKSYFVLMGDVAAVNAAVDAAAQTIGKELLDVQVMASPDPAVVRSFVRQK